MGEKLDEGLLLDLIQKRRAGKFTGDELLYAADHIEVIRWAMARPKVVAGIQRILSTLPTEMTIAGRTYEILSFLKEGEKSVYGGVMVERAKEMNAHLGQEDCEFLLAHQNEIPPALRGEIEFVFPDLRGRDPAEDREFVACLGSDDGGWYQGQPWLAGVWDDRVRLLRRKDVESAK
jgi:hypothetical protein